MKRAARPLDLTLEREVQHDVVKLYEDLGCVVARLSQYRASRVVEGLPDLLVFPPLRARSAGPFWHEVKTPSGKQSPAQLEWQRLCEARGVVYVVGGTAAAIDQLRAIGLVAEPAGRPVPRQASVHGAQG